MNKWWVPAFACFFWAVLTPMFIGYVYGWNITILELPLPIQIVSVCSFVLGNIGFVIFLIVAMMKEKFG